LAKRVWTIASVVLICAVALGVVYISHSAPQATSSSTSSSTNSLPHTSFRVSLSTPVFIAGANGKLNATMTAYVKNYQDSPLTILSWVLEITNYTSPQKGVVLCNCPGSFDGSHHIIQANQVLTFVPVYVGLPQDGTRFSGWFEIHTDAGDLSIPITWTRS